MTGEQAEARGDSRAWGRGSEETEGMVEIPVGPGRLPRIGRALARHRIAYMMVPGEPLRILLPEAQAAAAWDALEGLV